MSGLTQELQETLTKIHQGGGEVARKRHTDRRKLLARDRIDLLIDEGSPFLEFGALAGLNTYDDEIPAAGIITGIGRIHGGPH